MHQYLPFIILGFVLGIPIVIILFLHWRLEKIHKEDHQKTDSFLRFMQIESDKNTKYAEKILADIQKTNRDNSIFLRMILERVDKPQTE